MPGYVLAQLSGSVFAGMCLLWALGDHGAMGANLPNEAIGIAPATAFGIELFLSFLLMWVVAGVGLDKRAHGPLAGVAVGAVVGIEVMLMGPVAGAAMNPARALGPYVAMGDFTPLLDLRGRPAGRHGPRRLGLALHPRRAGAHRLIGLTD